jgi:amino acid adenylation domain-containing protein
MTAGTLDADLRAAARECGERTALVVGDRRLTYRELERAAEGFASGLRSLGVRRGDRVAIVLANSVEAAVAIYGVLLAGAAFTPLNVTTKVEKLTHLLGHCGAVAAVCRPDAVDAVRAAGAASPAFRHVIAVGEPVDGTPSFEALAAHAPADLPRPLDVDLSAIIYTSGSTGTPKGVVFLHRNMTFVASSIIEYLGLRASDRILCVLPLSHTYGLYHLVMAVRCRATLVLENGIAFPGRILGVLESERITVMPGVPTVWQALISLHGIDERRLPHLRVLTNAGAALSVARLQAVRRAFPGAAFYSMYGQTECKRVCYLPPDQLDAHPASVGIAIPGTEVWIEDADGNEPGPGAVGELMVRGDHVMQGYWNDPQSTARKLKAGRWPGDRVLRTGDLFRRDEEGYLYFVSRSDDIIKSRGEKVAPREVEEVLYTYAGVHEAAVIGVEDDLLGQAVEAHVSAAEGHTLDSLDLRRHCRAHLEDFMVPRRVIVHDALPKNDNGKLDKIALGATYGRSLEGAVA